MESDTTTPCPTCGLPPYQGNFTPDHPKRCCLRGWASTGPNGDIQCEQRGIARRALAEQADLLIRLQKAKARITSLRRALRTYSVSRPGDASQHCTGCGNYPWEGTKCRPNCPVQKALGRPKKGAAARPQRVTTSTG